MKLIKKLIEIGKRPYQASGLEDEIVQLNAEINRRKQLSETLGKDKVLPIDPVICIVRSEIN